MAMNDECFLELEVEEQLFAAVVHCPFEEHKNLVHKLQDINVKNGSGRSLLHVAVRLGKLDWVEGLLGCLADPIVVDNKGFTVLEVAKDMVEKRPKDNDMKMVLRFVRLASEVGCKVRESMGTSVGRISDGNHDQKTDVDFKEEVRDSGSSVALSHIFRISLEMGSLHSSVEELRNDTATQIGDLCQQQLSSSAEISSIKENIQSLTRCVSSLKGTTQTAQGDIVSHIDKLSQRVASAKVEITSLRQNLDAVPADMSFMRESLTNLQSDMTSIAAEVTSVGAVLREVKRELHSVVMRRESDTSGQLDSLKKAVEEVHRGLEARDTLLQALETSVTSMAESLAMIEEENKAVTAEPQGAVEVVKASKEEIKGDSNGCDPTKNHWLVAIAELVASALPEQKALPEGVDNSTSELQHSPEAVEGSDETGAACGINPSIIQTVDEEACLRCAEAMTKKTWIFNDDHSKASEVTNYYRILFQRSPMSAFVLSFLARHPLVKVSIDFTSSKIINIKGNFDDHDGTLYRVRAHVNSVADFAESRVYLGGLVERCATRMLAHFMKSLTQLALLLLFNNMGRPYDWDDYEKKDRIRDMLREASQKKFNEGKDLDWYLNKAVVCRIPSGREMLLIAAVPAIMVKYGSENGTSVLEEELSSLLDFYMDHVMIALSEATSKLQEV